jgi:hypothetical protein
LPVGKTLADDGVARAKVLPDLRCSVATCIGDHGDGRTASVRCSGDNSRLERLGVLGGVTPTRIMDFPPAVSRFVRASRRAIGRIVPNKTTAGAAVASARVDA